MLFLISLGFIAGNIDILINCNLMFAIEISAKFNIFINYNENVNNIN